MTRDSKPVARLLPFLAGRVKRRKRFDPDAHTRWLRRFWAGKPKPPSTGQMLARDRAD